MGNRKENYMVGLLVRMPPVNHSVSGRGRDREAREEGGGTNSEQHLDRTGGRKVKESSFLENSRASLSLPLPLTL